MTGPCLVPCSVCGGMHSHRCDQPPQVRHQSSTNWQCPACGRPMLSADERCSGSFLDTDHPSSVEPIVGSPPVVDPGPSRADVLSDLVSYAFDELLWISEAPNRGDVDERALELALRARQALVHIEANDPDKEWNGP